MLPHIVSVLSSNIHVYCTYSCIVTTAEFMYKMDPHESDAFRLNLEKISLRIVHNLLLHVTLSVAICSCL